MSEIFFIADLHLGHKRILEFSGDFREGNNVEEHDDWIISQWNSRVSKRDTVWVLGDVAFSREALSRVSELKGYKRLVLGNHDRYHAGDYLEYFNTIHGIVRYKKFWLSHAPIHSDHLRGLRNIHGHLHEHLVKADNGTPDEDYINVSVEQLNGIPISMDEIINSYTGDNHVD